MRDVGNCAGFRPVGSSVGCSAAARSLGLAETSPTLVNTTNSVGNEATLPFGCYWTHANPGGHRLGFNLNGDRNNADSHRASLCHRMLPF